MAVMFSRSPGDQTLWVMVTGFVADIILLLFCALSITYLEKVSVFNPIHISVNSPYFFSELLYAAPFGLVYLEKIYIFYPRLISTKRSLHERNNALIQGITTVAVIITRQNK